jgi:hypothetical protein
MTKIILVSGVGNSGKTTSIRLFLANEGVHFGKPTGDVLVVLPMTIDGQQYTVGVATEGDMLTVQQSNFRFLRRHACDIIVCSSRSKGQTLAYVQSQVKSGDELVVVTTRQVARPGTDNARVAKEIRENLP